jgi:hypothetical protein
MDKKLLEDIIENKFESILSEEKSRGINDKILLKYLLKYKIKSDGLLLEIPIEEFDGGVCETENDNKKYKILDKNKYEFVISNIQIIMIEMFQKLNYKINVNYIGYDDKIKANKLSNNLSEKIVNIKFDITEIEIFPSINNKNDMFILKDSLSARYYAGDYCQYMWNYNETEAKKFIDLDELAISIIDNNFTNIKLIKYTTDDIINAFNKEEDKKMENIINLSPKDLEWFNSFEYSYWMNMAHISAQNDWLTSKERGFLMTMGKYKQDKRNPSYKQIEWLKKIYKEYINLGN